MLIAPSEGESSALDTSPEGTFRWLTSSTVGGDSFKSLSMDRFLRCNGDKAWLLAALITGLRTDKPAGVGVGLTTALRGECDAKALKSD